VPRSGLSVAQLTAQLTAKLTELPAVVIAPAPSTFRVTAPIPTPVPSLPLTATVTAAVYQPAAQATALQVIDIVGAVRSDFALRTMLFGLVNDPAPCAIFVWMTHS